MSNTRKLYRCSKCGSLTRWKIINHRSNVTKDSAIGYVWCKACWKQHTRPVEARGKEGRR